MRKPDLIAEKDGTDPGPVHKIWIKYHFKKYDYKEFSNVELKRVKDYLDTKKRLDKKGFFEVRNFLRDKEVWRHVKKI